jgi:hypothetical protein
VGHAGTNAQFGHPITNVTFEKRALRGGSGPHLAASYPGRVSAEYGRVMGYNAPRYFSSEIGITATSAGDC